MSKIQDALSSFGGNFARPTKFNVIVTLPKLLGGEAPQVVDILCKTVSQPEIQQTAIEMSFKGHKLSYPGRVNQAQTISMTFYVDERYQIYDIFKSWMNVMDDKYYGNGNTPMPVINKYGGIALSLVNYKESMDVKTSIFEGVFPLSVSEMSYDATNKDTVQEFTVNFAYFRVTDNLRNLMGFTDDAIGTVMPNEDMVDEIMNLPSQAARNFTYNAAMGAMNTSTDISMPNSTKFGRKQ